MIIIRASEGPSYCWKWEDGIADSCTLKWQEALIVWSSGTTLQMRITGDHSKNNLHYVDILFYIATALNVPFLKIFFFFMKYLQYLQSENTFKKNIFSKPSQNTVVAKMIRTLVFSPATKSQFIYFSVVCVSRKYQFTFTNIIWPLIVIIQWDLCSHKDSDTSQCSTQRSKLIIIQSRNRTNRDKNCGNVSKMLQETDLQNYSAVKSFRHLCKNAVKWGEII